MLATCWLPVLLLHHCFGAETTALGTHPAPLGSTKAAVHFGDLRCVRTPLLKRVAKAAEGTGTFPFVGQIKSSEQETELG